MNERVCKRRLGDAEQHRLGEGRTTAAGFRLGVLLFDLRLIQVVAPDQAGVAGLEHFQFLQHLTHDGFDMLVVDRHALQTIDLLNLVHEVFGQTPQRP